MNIGAFRTSLNSVEKILKDNDLFKSRGVKPIGNVSDEFKTASLKSSYFKCYKVGIQNLDYDFLLSEESFFQFSLIENTGKLPSIRYAFFQNPQDYISYEDFLQETLNSTYTEVGDSFIDSHEQYLTEKEINSSHTTIRYDLDHFNYKPLIHSTAHFHVGNSENIRIPCNKVLTPIAFTIFIFRHIYHDVWKNIISDLENFKKNYLDSMKDNCVQLEEPFWQINPEEKEFYLI